MDNYKIYDSTGKHISFRTVSEYRAYVITRDIARRQRDYDNLVKQVNTWKNATLFEKITLWLDGQRPSESQINHVERSF
jgi:hypothetical protein